MNRREPGSNARLKRVLLAGIALLWVAALACTRGAPSVSSWSGPETLSKNTAVPSTTVPARPGLLPTPQPDLPVLTPTPDAPHSLPGLRLEDEQYIVQPGDALGLIARRYNVTIELLLEANQLPNPDYLEVGQLLTIPAPQPGPIAPAFKVIPDSELVYGPASASLEIPAFVQSYGGYLQHYEQEVESRTLSGPQIVQRVAQDFSVNPRLLLAVLEYQSGWVTQAQPNADKLETPILVAEDWRKGLYFQLAWAANNLNRGYYLWRAGGLAAYTLPQGDVIPANETINAGTAAVQHMFSLIYDRPSWERAVTAAGLQATYQGFFGYPFHWAVEPLLLPGLRQPQMQLPIEAGQGWAFTGGPHGGWGDGSAWAALDFAPPGSGVGCVSSDAWVVAVAGGLILRADQGAVIQDLALGGSDNSAGQPDGLEQTGWVVLYMHIESRDRVQAGDYLRAGDRIGHPSCEGGVSTGTHLHLARRYNGEWIAADQDIPFVLEGWVSQGAGREYDGYLVKDGNQVEAWEGFRPENTIWR